MELATAAMHSLLPKLVELLQGEYKLQKDLRKDVEFLEREMRSIDVALRKVAMVPPDKLDENSKIWANDVKKLSYEMEDAVERFLVVGFVPATNPGSFKGFVKKVSNVFTEVKTRHQIAYAIKGIKDQVQQVADRRDRYKIDDVEASQATTTIIDPVDPRMMVQFKDQRELVGIKKPRDELIKRLVDDDCVSKQKLKVLSIFGFGGLGKTTLARAVYDKLQTKFECKAFYSVGQNPNLKNVLIGILLRLEKDSCSNETMLDEGLLIEKLRELLANKRYLIIVDDIWDMSSWDILKCAFIDSECGSRVITTTRIFEVAKVASDIYMQEPLSPGRSKEFVYPEDYEIKKQTLIWKWLAEGYVHEEPGKDLFEIGEKYFNVLIDRSMIQAVEKPYHSVIYACRVHDLVLDMIHFLLKEETLGVVLNSNRTLTSPHSLACRSAMKNEVIEQDGCMANKSMQQVRSYNATMCHFSMLPLLTNFKALRVLALEECTFLTRGMFSMKPEVSYPYHLKHLGKLIHLRYLGISCKFGLRGRPIVVMPEEIGDLRFLQVLDLSGADIIKLPRSVGQLTQLKCMRFGSLSVGLSNWTNITSREEMLSSGISFDFLKDLGKLMELREFKIGYQELGIGNVRLEDLMETIGNLHKLQVIEIDLISYGPWSGYNGSVVLGHLRHLRLNGQLPGLPMWINSSCLPNLCHLYMRLKATKAWDMEILGRFSELITLQIRSRDYIVFPDAMEEGAFPKLRYLELSNVVRPEFVWGAMPSLESLMLYALVLSSGVDFNSLENLPRLEKVDVHIHGTAAMRIDMLQAIASLKHTIEIHPNRPTLKSPPSLVTGHISRSGSSPACLQLGGAPPPIQAAAGGGLSDGSASPLMGSSHSSPSSGRSIAAESRHPDSVEVFMPEGDYEAARCLAMVTIEPSNAFHNDTTAVQAAVINSIRHLQPKNRPFFHRGHVPSLRVCG
ncbi:disease resistance protein PIK6-NP-like [Triticum aestivum]|uniref:disease resistance protein PIK6-NP-like n=1 Tax=Triticum aestivum TaxID=4565 RepID=UPI001D028ACC|nr:disease resistance protein PIK6-NP-like [Triticum aestivum]